jgi:hypothetical protein
VSGRRGGGKNFVVWKIVAFIMTRTKKLKVRGCALVLAEAYDDETIRPEVFRVLSLKSVPGAEN